MRAERTTATAVESKYRIACGQRMRDSIMTEMRRSPRAPSHCKIALHARRHQSAAVLGIDSCAATVEVDASRGLPSG